VLHRWDRDGFVPGKDSLSAAELQWGDGEERGKGKLFPLIGKEELFYFALQELRATIRYVAG
jgi:hypothetical protein